MTQRVSATRLTLAGLLTIMVPALTEAQVTFLRAYGGDQSDDAKSVLQLPDRGYVFGGQTNSFGSGSYDFWLVRTDSYGETLWTRTYGGAAEDLCYSVEQTADGGCIMAGSTTSYGAGLTDAWLVKTNVNGDTAWTRTYGDTLRDGARSVQQTCDGGYIFAGSTMSSGAGSSDFWLVRTDSLGEMLWARTYGGASFDWGEAVTRTTDSGYIIAGNTRSFGAGRYDIWLVKTSPLGDTEWTRTYGDTGQEGASSVQRTGDGGFIIAGHTESFSANGSDVWLVRTDSNGDTAWTRTYNHADVDAGYSVQQTMGGGFVVAGQTLQGDRNKAYLITTDSRGETLWTRTYGGLWHDQAWSVRQTNDGGYIFAGNTLSFGPLGNNGWLVKTDFAGNVAVEEWQPPFAPHPSPFATICRDVLTLSAGHDRNRRGFGSCPKPALLDACGRRVMALAPGPNDIRRLPPGIYFIRSEEPAAAKALVVK